MKCEEVYLHAYASLYEARASIGRYLDLYNSLRPHQGLARQTPDQAYFDALLPIRRRHNQGRTHLATAPKLFRSTKPALLLN